MSREIEKVRKEQGDEAAQRTSDGYKKAALNTFTMGIGTLIPGSGSSVVKGIGKLIGNTLWPDAED